MMWWWLVSAAWATPVLYEGGTEAGAVATVAARTGLPAAQLEAMSLVELRERPPAVLGEAVLRRCTGQPATNADVRAELARAEVALAEDDMVAVTDHLDLAVARMSCLSEVVDGPAVARVFLLRGGIAAEAGRADEARGELVTALAFDPRVLWPTGYPSEGSTLLAEVAAAPVDAALTVAPRPTSGPWLDGRERTWPVEVRGGLHLAQHSARTGLATAWLVVGGAASWVLPEALSPSALDRFVEGEQLPLSRALLAVHPDEPAAYVVHQGGVWLVLREAPEPAVQQLVAPDKPDDEAPSDGGKRKGKKGSRGR